MCVSVATQKLIIQTKPSSQKTSQASRGTYTDMSVKRPLTLLETSALVVWDKRRARWASPYSTLCYCVNAHLQVFMPSFKSVYMSTVSTPECPQTPALRSCTSYWLNNGNCPLPICWSQLPEEPRISIWSLILRTCSTEGWSKWPRQQVSQNESKRAIDLCVRDHSLH